MNIYDKLKFSAVEAKTEIANKLRSDPTQVDYRTDALLTTVINDLHKNFKRHELTDAKIAPHLQSYVSCCDITIKTGSALRAKITATYFKSVLQRYVARG